MLTKKSVENLLKEFPLSESESENLQQRIKKRQKKYKAQAQKRALTQETLMCSFTI